MNNGNNWSILYYNARSILPKHDELCLVVEVNNPDIVCIVESWLGHDVRDQEIAIPNYNIFRLDRNRHGGGILIILRTPTSLQCCLVPPLIWKSLLFVYKVEIVKLAFHFFTDLPVPLQLFLVIFVNIWSHSTLPSILILYYLEILMLIL